MPAGLIGSLLIANRGEIACRIIRTARRMGIRTVAVYSDADARALHVRAADEAVHIGPSPARESYLVAEKIIAAAKESGAEAIHPGYGFLSENADFAQAVIDAGLIWVGPTPASIRAMGLKDAAKKLMAEAGVPVTPGYLGEDQDPKRLKKEADAIGYPVLIKAVAGGGGKGMRRVEAAGEFGEMLLSCKREAAASFGDEKVLIEKYIERPRHIEVQVFGDTHGNVVHLFERDCSLQRRHQKVIEEAPAPGMDEATRAAVCDAAVKAAKAVDYVGAGTIEFIADASQGLRADRIWFMEMNTRLQVEHPVTEEITGQDLVEWQLRVASGEKLPRAQDDIRMWGSAIEVRLYAEDPANNFLPSTGRLERFHIPRGNLRVETGVEQGETVSPHYDPMIAKLVCTAGDRRTAALHLAGQVRDIVCWPVRTNAGLLHRLLVDPAFTRGAVHTGFIDANDDELILPSAPGAHERNLAAQALAKRAAGPALAGFRLNAPREAEVRMMDRGEVYAGSLDAVLPPDLGDWMLAEPAADGVYVTSLGRTWKFEAPAARADAAGAAGDGALTAPMPGRIIAVGAKQGETVRKGQRLVTLEAMKMEHSLVAPFDGIVAELEASEGAQVSEGALLVRIEKGEG